MSSRNQGIRLYIKGLVLACLSAPSPASAANAGALSVLETDEAARGVLVGCGDREARAGDSCESHRYLLAVAPGKRWLLSIDQAGIDTVVTLRNEAAGYSSTISSPLGAYERETLAFESDATGDYVVELAGKGFAGARGEYEILLTPLDDLPRAEVFEQINRAAAAYWLGSEASRLNAASLYREAAGSWQQLGDEAEEARALFCLGAILEELDDFSAALTAKERALSLYRRADRQKLAGHLLSDVGLIHSYTGNPDVARELLMEALAVHEASGDETETATTLNNIALVAHYGGDLEQAEEYYRQALSRFREAGELKSAANTLNNIGGVFYMRGEPASALEHFRQSADIGRRILDRETEVNALGNIGALDRFTGYLQDALGAHLTILGYARSRSDDAAAARSLDRIGVAYHALGQLDRASTFLNAGLELRTNSADLRGRANSLHNLGALNLSRGNPSAALQRFQAARLLREQLENRSGVARALIGEARAMLDLIEGFDETERQAMAADAIRSLDSALNIAREVGDRRHEAIALQHRGVAYARTGDGERGQADLAEALALHDLVANLSGEAQTLYAKARLEYEIDGPDEALATIVAASDVVESMDDRVRDPQLGASLFSFRSEVMELHIELLMAMHQSQPDKGYNVRAFEVADRGRARALRQLRTEAARGQPARPDQADADDWQRWTAEYTHTLNRQREIMSRAPEEHDALAGERLNTKIALGMLELIEDNARSALVDDDSAKERLVTVGELQQLLDEDTLLLKYSIGRDESFVWVVGKEQFESFELGAGTEIDRMALAAYQSLSTYQPFPDRGQTTQLSALSETLLPSALFHSGAERLVVIADRLVHYVPFAALLVGSEESGAGRGTRLIDWFEVSYLPSASVLRELRGRTAASSAFSPVAVFADPVFDAEDRRLAKAAIPVPSAAYVSASPVERSIGNSLLALDRLPATRREAETIRSLTGERTMVALDFDANRDAVLGDSLRNFAVIHFATHGFADARYPLLSGLALSMVSPTGQQQIGYLGLRDIHDMNLSAQLVVLSGCQTALGEEIRSEGLIGLTRAFMYAGAPRVVATLWTVPDRSTAVLMEHFYEGVFLYQLTPAAALHRAQQALKSERRWRDPHVWAAFVLQGDWK